MSIQNNIKAYQTYQKEMDTLFQNSLYEMFSIIKSMNEQNITPEITYYENNGSDIDEAQHVDFLYYEDEDTTHILDSEGLPLNLKKSGRILKAFFDTFEKEILSAFSDYISVVSGDSENLIFNKEFFEHSDIQEKLIQLESEELKDKNSNHKKKKSMKL